MELRHGSGEATAPPADLLPSGFPFVGRAAESARLRAAVPAPGDPGRRLLVLGGAGIGKSRLVMEFAAAASSRVLLGRAWDHVGAPAYGLWRQVVAELLGTDDPASLRGLVLDDDTGASRLEFFDEVARLLHDAAAEQPLTVVLEDLHAADPGSMLLTRFLAEELREAPVLLLGTLRREPGSSAEPATEDPFADWEQLALEGLNAPALREILADRFLAEELQRRTGGNPLFLEQLVRLGTDRGGAGQVGGEAALRTVTTLRLAELPEEVDAVVSALAVLGSGTAVDDLGALLETDPEALAAGLAAAEAQGVLTVLPGARRSAMFQHPLLAELASTRLTPARRRELHGRAAELLAARSNAAAERAYHLRAAEPGGSGDTARAFRSAGDAASAELAYEDAVAHYRRAIAALPESPEWAGERVELLCQTARALWRQGAHPEAMAASQEAWLLASAAASPTAMGLAALGPAFRFGFAGEWAAEHARRCETALARLEAGPSALRVQLLAGIACSRLADDPQQAGRTAAAAVAMARTLRDAGALGYALIAASVADMGPDTLDARLAMAREVMAIVATTGDRSLAEPGHYLLMGALLERGDVSAVDSELATRHRSAEGFSELRRGRHAGWFRCMRAIMQGRADDAEALAAEALATAEREGDADALSVYVGQLGVIRWLQGRATEAEPFYLRLRQEQPAAPVWSAVLAWLWACDGRLEAARGAIAAVGAIEAVPRDRNWCLSMACLAEAASLVEDRAAAEALREQLLPFVGRLVPIALGIATWGTVARPLGLLARLLGRHEEAIAHFETAIRVCAEAGALPWLAEAQLDLAETLLADADAAARAAAEELVAEAGRAAESLALGPLLARLPGLRRSLGGGAPRAAAPAAVAPSRPRIAVLGTFEVFSEDGRLARWSSRKARELLKLLVARHGGPIAREELIDQLWPEQDPEAVSNRLSVAISTIRRALDPARRLPPDAHLASDHGGVRLRLEKVAVDAEEFLQRSAAALAARSAGAPEAREALRSAAALYRGTPLADEPYALWAETLRTELRGRLTAVSMALEAAAREEGDQLLAAEACRRLLSEDPFHEAAHRGLIDALSALGAHGQAREAEARYRARMQELGLPG